MVELVPIRVKIGLRANGHADHPNWNLLPLAMSSDPASHMRGGWRYDKTSGHKEDTPESPFGMQWGMLLVTEQFAAEALVKFPGLITVLSEAQAEDFWENKAHAHVPENNSNSDILQSLKTELDLRTVSGLETAPLIEKIKKAINPDNKEPGIVKNKFKKWADGKNSLGFKIKPL